MRRCAYNKEGFSYVRWTWLALTVLVIVFGVMAVRQLRACEVLNVWLWVGEDEDDVRYYPSEYQFFCEPNIPYWFWLEWSHGDGGPGGGNHFEVEVKDFTEHVVVWEDDVDDNDVPNPYVMDLVDEVNSPACVLDFGVHSLKAKVRRDGIGEWVDSDYCAVHFGCSCGAENLIKFVPDFGCGVTCSGETEPETDCCGNQLKINCSSINDICAYRYWYQDADANSFEQIGWCPWKGGRNVFYYWENAEDNFFTQAMHISFNQDLGVDSQGEGCPDYYCYRVEKYDCVNDVNIGVWWRSTTDGSFLSGQGWYDETTGIACANDTGIHRGHPN